MNNITNNQSELLHQLFNEFIRINKNEKLRITNENKNDNRFIIIPCKYYDRMIILAIDDIGEIMGVNFRIGICDIAELDLKHFGKPCPQTTEMLDRLASRKKQSLNYLDNLDKKELMQLINEAIQMSIDAF